MGQHTDINRCAYWQTTATLRLLETVAHSVISSTGFEMKSVAAFTALFIAPILLSTLPAHASGLQGTWRGAGYLKPSSGKRLRVSCVISYSRHTSRVFTVSANCASNSGNVRQTGEVLKVRANTYVGDFYNRQFDIRGRVRVRVRGGRQTVTFSSGSGGGSVSLKRQ
jgi:hypothetical protein